MIASFVVVLQALLAFAALVAFGQYPVVLTFVFVILPGDKGEISFQSIFSQLKRVCLCHVTELSSNLIDAYLLLLPLLYHPLLLLSHQFFLLFLLLEKYGSRFHACHCKFHRVAQSQWWWISRLVLLYDVSDPSSAE